MKTTRYKNIVVFAFFLTFVLIGWMLHGDYGISWDESVTRLNGAVTVNHLVDRWIPWLKTTRELVVPLFPYEPVGVPPLAVYTDRDYGVAFEAPLFILENLLNLKTQKDIYIFRHLITYLFCIVSYYAIYFVIKNRYDDWRLGLLAVIFTLLTPKLFAESFYNSKDMVFMSSFAMAIAVAGNFLQRPTIRTAIFASVIGAIAIDIRMMAIVVPIVTASFICVRLIKKELSPTAGGALLIFYLCLTCFFVILFWPWLWSSPVKYFLLALSNMSHFRWDGYNLYMGKLIPSGGLPWHYTLVWMLVTIPVLYIILFIIGLFINLKALLANNIRLWANEQQLLDLFHLALLFGPLIAVALLKSTLYNGWRQMYFVYPPFIFIAMKGLHFLYQKHHQGFLIKMTTSAAIIISSSYLIFWTAKSHPYQNVYFNALAGPHTKELFELDYWGLTDREELEYIAKHDARELIKLYTLGGPPIKNSFLMLPEHHARRFREVNNVDETDYIFVAQSGESAAEKYSIDFSKYHEIIVDNQAISMVMKRRGLP